MHTILTLLAAALGVHGLPSASGNYSVIRDFAAIGYAYTGGNCRALTTKDASGNIWNYVNTVSINDGSTIFDAPLLRRDDTKEFIMFFPGSKDFSNYQQDLQIALTSYPYCPGCQVHQGLYQGWTASKNAVVNLIKANLVGAYVNYNVVPTGGSMGGALAAFAFAEFRANPDLGLKTKTLRGASLGEPRIGNFNFARWFNVLTGATPIRVGSWLRVTHGYDAVTRSPPVPQYPINQTPDGVYQHHGTEIWEVDNLANGNHPSAATTYTCFMRSDQSENTDCSASLSNPGNLGDHVTYAGYDGPAHWETVSCGAS